MTARISQVPKNAMQSGRGRTRGWVLEFIQVEGQKADPLTGWAGSGDTSRQVRLSFADLAAAQRYADANGITYTVIPTPERGLKLQTYADNFR